MSPTNNEQFQSRLKALDVLIKTLRAHQRRFRERRRSLSSSRRERLPSDMIFRWVHARRLPRDAEQFEQIMEKLHAMAGIVHESRVDRLLERIYDRRQSITLGLEPVGMDEARAILPNLVHAFEDHKPIEFDEPRDVDMFAKLVAQIRARGISPDEPDTFRHFVKKAFEDLQRSTMREMLITFEPLRQSGS